MTQTVIARTQLPEFQRSARIATGTGCCMPVIGETGSGKTTLITAYAGSPASVAHFTLDKTLSPRPATSAPLCSYDVLNPYCLERFAESGVTVLMTHVPTGTSPSMNPILDLLRTSENAGRYPPAYRRGGGDFFAEEPTANSSTFIHGPSAHET